MSVVLIPLDASVHSEYALQHYINFIHRPGNKVCTCYVADDFGDVGVMDGPTPGRVHELKSKDEQTAAAVDAHVTQVFRDNNIDGDFHRLYRREAWSMIIDYAKQIGANMIVMGSRGQGKVKRTVLGSVSSDVLHHAHIPVMICKHDKFADMHQQQQH